MSGLAIVEPDTGTNAVHVVPLAEERVSIVKPLPAGTEATRSSVVQSTVVPASNVRDWNVHGEVYGDRSSQSTVVS